MKKPKKKAKGPKKGPQRIATKGLFVRPCLMQAFAYLRSHIFGLTEETVANRDILQLLKEKYATGIRKCGRQVGKQFTVEVGRRISIYHGDNKVAEVELKLSKADGRITPLYTLQVIEHHIAEKKPKYIRDEDGAIVMLSKEEASLVERQLSFFLRSKDYVEQLSKPNTSIRDFWRQFKSAYRDITLEQLGYQVIKVTTAGMEREEVE